MFSSFLHVLFISVKKKTALMTFLHHKCFTFPCFLVETRDSNVLCIWKNKFFHFFFLSSIIFSFVFCVSANGVGGEFGRPFQLLTKCSRNMKIIWYIYIFFRKKCLLFCRICLCSIIFFLLKQLSQFSNLPGGSFFVFQNEIDHIC